ncbi:hypothetical protein KC19_VG042900 [Ceratodon purpureus]|uniref:Uncharacterized protein n=1 Tax=Ceratodon purpureus TaxID=3225 RepID=A0A8T0HLX2_CERPU|nr:hypothetical protein KC19_VG042900 [Ceratodon purpureus]
MFLWWCTIGIVLLEKRMKPCPRTVYEGAEKKSLCISSRRSRSLQRSSKYTLQSCGGRRSMASLRGREHYPKGSVPWFHKDQGLNNRGYIPGIREGEHCCMSRGKKTGGGFKFSRPNWSESLRMCRRIERLYRTTHQRPLPKSKIVGLAFARGLIAEKKGLPRELGGICLQAMPQGGV